MSLVILLNILFPIISKMGTNVPASKGSEDTDGFQLGCWLTMSLLFSRLGIETANLGLSKY